MFSIEYGGSYTVHDFVESCTDNSDTECRIAFATADSSGNATDFSNLTDSGTHTVVLTATDPSGNQATAEAKLIIGEKPQPKPEPKPEPQPEPKPAVVDLPYSIEINRQQNVVTVYTKGIDGQYTVPYKTFVCSTGGSNTPTGSFKLGARYEWLTLVGGVQGQYTTRIHGSIAFHSVPYFTRNKADLEYEEYNKLGNAASLGCVRMAVQDVKWVYENCAAGTPVKIFDSDEIGPLGKPTPIYIDPESPNRGWDPTDPDPANPWRQQG